MSDATSKSAKPTEVLPSLTTALGVMPTLPGESAEQYQQGLQGVIQELEAKTVMQVYLAEKIFECLWWMRRYEQQKHVTLIRGMACILISNIENKNKKKTTLWEELENFDIIDPAKNSPANMILTMEIFIDLKHRGEFEKLLKKSDYTEQSLLQEALNREAKTIADLNGQITVLAKTLSGFQASYEVLVNRKLNVERLRMQNERLAQELKAIELESNPDESKSPKTSSK
jgi:hypothetical protein